MRRSVVTFFGAALFALSAAPVSADAIRITVTFNVAGDSRIDPDYAAATSSGSFSVVTTLGPGDIETRHAGFGADQVSFTWAGTTWTSEDADVVQLGFDDAGRVNLWTLDGQSVVPGGTSFNASPDFSVSFCGFCSGGPRRFIYTTPRSLELGIFSGSLTSFTLTTEPAPAPTPEPATLVLLGTGLSVAAWRRRRGSAPASARHLISPTS